MVLDHLKPRAFFVALFPNCQLVTLKFVFIRQAGLSPVVLFQTILTFRRANNHFLLRLQSSNDTTKQHGGNQELDRL